ncbi:hypothetical protein L9F63_020318, partial [Diploptera punctata]
APGSALGKFVDVGILQLTNVGSDLSLNRLNSCDENLEKILSWIPLSKKKTAKKQHNTGRQEATDDGDKLQNCSIEEKGYEEYTIILIKDHQNINQCQFEQSCYKTQKSFKYH